MGPPIDPCPTSNSLPDATDVVIVGGGIVGLSTALALVRRGVRCLVLEKGAIAAEQSSRNWGWVRRMGRDPRELPLIVEAMRLWEGMAEEVGRDVGFRRTGILYLCETEADIARHEDWLARAGEHALDTRLVRGTELAALLQGATRSYPAALYTRSDGRAEPQKAAPAIAAAVQLVGGVIVDQCAVREIETSGGRVSGVITEKGRVACSSVVVAGGIWSSRLLRSLRLRLPQLGVRASVLRTGPVQGGPEGAAWGPSFAYRKRLDGGYTVADGTRNVHELVPDSLRYFIDFLPVLRHEWRGLRLGVGRPALRGLKVRSDDFEGTRTLDPAPSVSFLDQAYAALRSVFPAFEGVPVVQRWAGMIDATPDAIPVISRVESCPGLVVATGFSGHGFGIAPGAGQLAADLVLGCAPTVDPRPFRYERFIDGTRPRPTTGV